MVILPASLLASFISITDCVGNIYIYIVEGYAYINLIGTVKWSKNNMVMGS